MSREFNVLISAAGRRVALMNAFRKALSELKLDGQLLAVDSSPLSAAFHSADARFLVPDCRTESFIPFMLDLCKREQVSLIVPTIDTELPAYATHRKEFEAIGTTIAISSPALIKFGGDKLSTHSWLKQHNFPTVRQGRPQEVLGHLDDWAFPLIAKPVHGSASIGLAVVHDADELALTTRAGDYIVQSIAPGEEYTIDVLVNRAGKALCAVPRKRLEVRAGEVSKGLSVKHQGLQELAMRLCEALPDAYATITVQVFLDEKSDEMNIIEVNPRFGGGFPLACEAGADFPRWIIEEILDLPSSAQANAWQDGLVMLRYDDAVFVPREKLGL